MVPHPYGQGRHRKGKAAMLTFAQIYRQHPERYEQMVAREDYQGNLLRAIRAIRPLDGLDVVEFGAGTGRVTRLLSPVVRYVYAFDATPPMLGVAVECLDAAGVRNASLGVSDNRAMPVRRSVADLAIEGWSFGHMVFWYPHTWREEFTRALGEMARVLRPGGTMVIIETLGTGSESPQPPWQEMADLYRWLEETQGFTSTWVRTDYQFESLHEAETLARFFFGDELAARVIAKQWIILPECTGLWWRTV
jgi:ubiquinone/menaquinone biosynthesis C-methylase UbiE